MMSAPACQARPMPSPIPPFPPVISTVPWKICHGRIVDGRVRTSVRSRSRYGRLMAPGPLQLSFVRSYVDIDDLPYVNAEVAFGRRSNVGKSSLLNALAQRKNLAKTSKTPGATRLMRSSLP